MRIINLLSTFVLAASSALLPTLVTAAESNNQLTIPALDQEPQFSDFANMNPSSVLARQMVKVDSFVQREPDDGKPATQRTEVYLGYDRENLYAVFLAFDTNPSGIRAHLAPRENINSDDSVGMTVDTFNDQRSAYSFRVTPSGVQWDAQWNEVARNPDFDTSWEAVWQSEGELTDQGYMARMAIPLRSLRFPDLANKQWRIQLQRQIPRLSETSFWPPYSIGIEGRLNQAGILNGITNVSPGRNWQFVPFFFARDYDALDTRARGGPAFVGKAEQDIGLDAKLVFNDSMVLDLTINPDFSQVESDEPQVTVNERFEIQYPERRPFFVENADFFNTESILVFTRRIRDPEAGARFTGRMGEYGLGAMMINDQAPGLNRRANDPLKGEKANIGIIRGFKDISEQSRIGLLVTDRELADSFNRVASVDGRFSINQNWSTQMQLVKSDSETLTGQKLEGVQRNARFDRTGRMINVHSHFIETEPGFRADLGFLNRFFSPDTSGNHTRVSATFYPENSSITSWGPTMFAVYQEDFNNTRVFTQMNPSVDWNWAAGTRFSLGVAEFTEVLRPQDFSGLPMNVRYDYGNKRVSFGSNYFASVGFSGSYETGTAINLVPAAGMLPDKADQDRITFEVLWRPLDRLRVDNTYLRTKLDSRNGGGLVFSNEIFRSRWNYQFTRELSVRFIAQYEETDAGPMSRLEDVKGMNFDLLLRYVLNPWSAFYIGYNSNASNFELVDMGNGREVVRVDDLNKDGDQFFVKFSYLFQR